MKTYGLLGFPLGHSFSKKYFSEKFSAEKINAVYQNFEFSDIDVAVDFLKSQSGLAGFNITIPYKELILPFLDETDIVVDTIAACNCVKIEKKIWKGFNTDVIGFEKSVGATILNNHKKALIFGTGGAAKSVAYVLKIHGIDYQFVSRKEQPGNMRYGDLSEKILREFTLLINTTPLGMSPQTNEAPEIPYQYLNKDHFVFDLIYNPEKTLFLQKAESQGATIKNGNEMLHIQAKESWKIWNS